MKSLLFSIFIFLSLQLLFLAPSDDRSKIQQSLSKHLPGEDERGEWVKWGDHQEYRGEDLFLYIDGGAEIYHEYGFKQVIVQDYKNNEGKSISLEIFLMESPESAYGMFSFKTGLEGKDLVLGDGAALSDYYLNFWKGNFLVTMTGFDESEETIEGLLRIGQAVEARIKMKGEEPPLVSALPETGLITSSIKYFQGHLGLYNSYHFFTKDVFRLKEGVKGDYQSGYSIYLIKYKEGEECSKRFTAVKESFKTSPRYKNYRAVNDQLICVEDRKENSVYISYFDKYIFMILGKISRGQEGEILEKIKEGM